MPDEWIENLPNVKRYNKEMKVLVKNEVFSSDQGRDMLKTEGLGRFIKSGENVSI